MKATLDEFAPEVGMAKPAARWVFPGARRNAGNGHECTGRDGRGQPPRALTEPERKQVLAVLNSERFVDKAPATVYATFLDEDEYLCHWRTMYRILAASGEIRERRDQVRHPKYAPPELIATAPNQVWTWDVTWLRGPVRYSYYPLYTIIDLFSRFNPGWMLAHEENGELASNLIRETCRRQGIEPGTLTIHADRGRVPKGKTVKQLLRDLEIARSLSRPRVSNDNLFSESEFHTMESRPDLPDRFNSFEHAREHCGAFFPWYNGHHRHSGIAYLTPADVHYGRAPDVIARRQAAMNDAIARHPERLVAGRPQVPTLPKAVWTNPPRTAPRSSSAFT